MLNLRILNFAGNKNFVVREKSAGFEIAIRHDLYSFTLLSFPITFFLPSALPWLPLRHELYMTTLDALDDDSNGTSPFQQPVHHSLPLLTLTPSIIALLFLADRTRWPRI
jgi:hypothetical protein